MYFPSRCTCMWVLAAFLVKFGSAAPSPSDTVTPPPTQNSSQPCSPNFFKDPAYGHIQFVNRGASTWNKRGLTNAQMIEVTDCITPGKQATTWVDYAKRPLRKAAQGPGGTTSWAAKRCQTFRVDNGDGMWSNQEANNTYSIQTYHTYQRVADLNGTVRTFTSGVGWQMVDGGIRMNLLGYKKQDTQLWTFECPCDRTNAAGDAAAGWVARDCAVVNYSTKGGRYCMSFNKDNDAISVARCAPTQTDPWQLWNIVLVNKADMVLPANNDIVD